MTELRAIATGVILAAGDVAAHNLNRVAAHLTIAANLCELGALVAEAAAEAAVRRVR